MLKVFFIKVQVSTSLPPETQFAYYMSPEHVAELQTLFAVWLGKLASIVPGLRIVGFSWLRVIPR